MWCMDEKKLEHTAWPPAETSGHHIFYNKRTIHIILRPSIVSVAERIEQRCGAKRQQRLKRI